VYGEPDTWEGFWYIAAAQQFQGSVGNPLEDLPRKIGDLAALAERELGVLALLLPAAAIVTIRRFPRFALLTGLATLVTVAFSASYANADIGRYYLGPLLMAWSWLGILAATTADTLVSLAGPPPLGPAADDTRSVPQPIAEAAARLEPDEDSGGSLPGGSLPGGSLPGETWLAAVVAPSRLIALAVAALLALPAALAIPERHRAIDQSGDPGARPWLESALARFADNAVVVSWWSYSTPLWYAQKVEGRRPDIFIVDDRTRLDEDLGEATDVIARFIGQRPVYVIRANQHDLELVTARFQLRPGSGAASDVYEVIGPAGTGT
jgi:hypothetical protein